MGRTYPAFQARGFASQFAFPFAKQVCKGAGLDIGCMCKEWAFPGAMPIDISFDDGYHALNLPELKDGWDYIFSSHSAEHYERPYKAFDYWHTHLTKGGVLFLYLPDFSQTYWRSWLKTNSEHIHVFTPEIIEAYFTDQPDKWKNVFVSSVDLNNSFCAMAEKV